MVVMGMILVFGFVGLPHMASMAHAQPWGQDTTDKMEPSPDQAEKTEPSPIEEEEIHAGPKDIKEEIGIYVFLGWLWLSIFVMIYLLRQKIRETDRLHAYHYFKASETKPSE
jgi:hypothetical protein